MKNPPIFKNGKPSISMGHLYHGYVSHNQMVQQLTVRVIMNDFKRHLQFSHRKRIEQPESSTATSPALGSLVSYRYCCRCYSHLMYLNLKTIKKLERIVNDEGVGGAMVALFHVFRGLGMTSICSMLPRTVTCRTSTLASLEVPQTVFLCLR